MDNAQVPILGFAAFSGTGKTTLLVKTIPLLKQRGLRVGVIKHSHHSFEIDHPGKDSYELRKAGATPIMLVSHRRRATITEFTEDRDPALDDQIAQFNQTGLDLVLVEGFKREKFPKIELHRPSLGKPLLFPKDDSIIAVASDTPLDIPEDLTPLDINRPEDIAAFIVGTYLRHEQ